MLPLGVQLMGRLLFALFALIAVLATTSAMAQEPARLALLVGNGGYAPKVGQLKNPRNDVALIGRALKELGFKVTTLEDADYRSMDTAIKRYVAEVRNAGKGAISFFYYSGHGVANPDTQINYLIPVDVSDPSDASLWYQSFQQNDVIDKLSKQAPNATHYVVFDACRNELNLSVSAAKALGAEKGFVPVQQMAGLLIAYATAPNKTASDVGEGGGPYARALAEELIKPGVEAVTMFRNVQIRVKESIGQDPWLSFPSLPSIYLAGRVDTLKAEAARAEAAKAEAARAEAAKAAAQAEIAKAEAARALAQAEIAKSEAARAEATKTEATKAQAANAAAEAAKAEVAKAEAAKATAQAEIAKAEAARTLALAEIAKSEAAKAEAAKAAAQIEAAKAERLASLAPTAEPPPKTIDAAGIAELLKFHLKRVGCDPGSVEGTWNAESRRAMESFNKQTGSQFDVAVASLDALDAVRARTSRVCPLVCGPGTRLEGERCVTTCESGSVLGSDGTCQKRKPAVAAEHPPARVGPAPAPRVGGKCFAFNGKQFCE
jgi:uncharacterized caspase-like protein